MTESEQELRDERTAIMAAEGATQSDIDSVFKKYVDIYGIADYTEKQESLI